MSLQRPAVEFQSWEMKTPTYIGENVLPEVERRKNPFVDLISELEWENQPCRKKKKIINWNLNKLEVRDNVEKDIKAEG